MVRDRRKPSERVAFEPPRPATLLSADGTWSRPCHIREISETDAHLAVSGDMPASTMTEFFLLLTSNGNVHRRCVLASLGAEHMDVVFLKTGAPAPMMLSLDMIEPDHPPRQDVEFDARPAFQPGGRSTGWAMPT